MPLADRVVMGLSRIVYISSASNPFSDAELRRLANNASVKNGALGISGLRVHSGGNFIQVLEGEEMAVMSLYSRISADHRHADLRPLLRRPAANRLFPEWGMQLATTTERKVVDREAIDKTLLRLRLTPDSQTVESDAISLLREFRRQLMDAA
jgi:FAD-dependent sensor of blue light